MNMEAKVISPLEKVFYESEIKDFSAYPSSTALIGERHSFCIAYRNNVFGGGYEGEDLHFSAAVRKNGRLYVTGTKHVTVSAIGHVPSVFPAPHWETPDPQVRTAPGLFPDVLVPVTPEDMVRTLPQLSYSLWVDLDTTGLPAGKYTVTVTAHNDTDGAEAFSLRHAVEILPAQLPPQKLLMTHWLHTDCIADYYHIRVFSREWWHAVEDLISRAIRTGTNMIYTPLFTPPLDTNVGGERTTVQLVDVEKHEDGTYTFGFQRFRRWIAICKKYNAAAFEMSHLFTQWGAYHTPKIMAKLPDGKVKRIFGWDADSAGPEYEAFLSAFLPALDEELHLQEIADRTYFHISDEPSIQHIESYSKCSAIIHKYLHGYKLMDALSKPDFYEKGLTEIPVPHIEHAEPFLKMELDPRFIYYCGISRNKMGRAFGLPSLRNRITGAHLYAIRADGMLHWGFNFYNSCRSIRHIDPYAVTDADQHFVSGDSFMIYPAPDYTFYDSLRLAVFEAGLEDLRAFQLCESLYGRDKVLEVLAEENGGKAMWLDVIPDAPDYTLRVRERINAMIASASSKEK